MVRIIVWDYPVRIFHWAFVACFFSALGFAEFASEHSLLFNIHMVLGLVLAPMVFLRILWGFIGTKHARFTSFSCGVKELFEYLAGIVTLKGKRYVGHNPAASYAAIAMLVLAVGIVASGLLMGQGEFFEEVHGALAYLMLAVVVAHVCGVILHVVRHKENIVVSMFSGRKEGEETDAISSKPMVAIVFILLVGIWTWTLIQGYDGQTQRLELPLIGNVQLGEGGSDESHEKKREVTV